MEIQKDKLKKLNQLPVKITDWVGSTKSLILHTALFVLIFALRFFNVSTNDILLILTTAVSLEAIYLSIFIQMTVNRNTQSLVAVEEDIDEIQEDVEKLEKDVDEIQEDVGEIQEEEHADTIYERKNAELLLNIESTMKQLTNDIAALKNQKK
ncbi:MAG: hypothetical protein G01um101477_38 [Candidatus Doudnabacteria bacterium Gr01-1014_77]|uniref:DUF1003 domain-containing protein n=1 Tax=Candidatus Doudnabacteria bacterium Gr01-1014_77 TaxID=2017133 RepID=A0A554JEB7_9BACT|nr:MAG: hypothetical protein G01um101477_38 [Candidatus Doudnabacteria bacterium Gr01-1014_77]